MYARERRVLARVPEPGGRPHVRVPPGLEAGPGRADLSGGGEAGVPAHGAAPVRLLQVHQKENQGRHNLREYTIQNDMSGL